MAQQTARPAETCLKFLLRMNGVLAVMAVVAVVMPHSWLIWCIGKVEPDLPVLPLVSYLARFLSAFYVLLGAMLLVFATDVRRYMRPIRVMMLWCMFAAGALFLVGLPYAARLLRQWFFWFVACDITIAAALGVLVLLLQRRIGQHGRRNRAPE